ncbi:MAG: protein kinase [Anaerolineae bacterium]
MIGEELGRYRILEHQGSGGMAEVYKAHHPGLDRYVAVKVLHSFLAQEQNFLARFRREAKAVAALRHPNIVQVFDFEYDEERGLYYMVMEFIDGPSLKVRIEELAQEGKLMPLDEIVRIGTAIGDALDYAHKRGMVHRDVKPANVMFNSEGEVILTDFGIAKMVSVDKLTASGEMIGTPAYMAPEQAMGQAGDERADIYSLGVMLYQMATGALPFEADTPIGVALKHINEPLPHLRDVNPNLPRKLDLVVTRAMVKDPGQRYQTAAEVVADLEGEPAELESLAPALEETVVSPVVSDTPPMPQPGLAPEPAAVPRRKKRLRRWLVFLLSVIVLVLLAGEGRAFYGDELSELGAYLWALPRPWTRGTPTPNLAATEVAATAAAIEAIQSTLEAPTATPTPDTTATAIAACVFDVEVLNDRAVWPAVLMPGQRFVKRWQVRNSGTCTWPEDIELVFVSGYELELVEAPQIELLKPEQATEIHITLRAPTLYNSYVSVWQLQDGEGKPIGGEMEIICRVGPTPTPQLTVTPTITATPTVTPSTSITPTMTPAPGEELWMSLPTLRECYGTAEAGYHGGQVGWGAGGGPSGEYHYFYGAPVAEQELPGPYNDFEGFPHNLTYFTVSGPGDSWPQPEDCDRRSWGDEGWCKTSDGYEIVWMKVWITEDTCP